MIKAFPQNILDHYGHEASGISLSSNLYMADCDSCKIPTSKNGKLHILITFQPIKNQASTSSCNLTKRLEGIRIPGVVVCAKCAINPVDALRVYYASEILWKLCKSMSRMNLSQEDLRSIFKEWKSKAEVFSLTRETQVHLKRVVHTVARKAKRHIANKVLEELLLEE